MLIFKKNKTKAISRHEKISCTKVVCFDAGHRVFDADTTKCEKLHGHHYTAELTFTADMLTNGMVIDFCLIKEKVQKWINENWDHNVILSHRDAKLAKAISQETGQAVFLLNDNATTELMAIYLLNLCNQTLFKEEDADVVCTRVKLYETASSFVEYKIDD